MAAVEGDLSGRVVEWDTRASLGVVMAAGGYPGSYHKGDAISGLDDVDDAKTKVFHAGTADQDGHVVTSGGRVLCVVGLGDTVAQAQEVAYRGVNKIKWDDVYFRTDIGHRAINRDCT
jgi:phosphoribosylamine--glycine ligase